MNESDDDDDVDDDDIRWDKMGSLTFLNRSLILLRL